MDNKLTLFELNNKIQSSLKGAFPDSLWVVAEISEKRTNRTGHCYLELIQKEEDSENIIARARATIWSYTYRMLKPYFETTTGHEFTNGIKVLVCVSVEFHEQYGLSLNITDIDPNYTLGDMARKRMEIITRLEEEGVINMNKELELPALPQKIAVISSDTAAGYDDFKNQLENNPLGYKFYIKLFPAIMQGDNAEKSITDMLDKIFQFEDFFDIVVIIRGGGSKADLSCFDSYWLAYNITQFPLPVITGIGHERDDSIADLVAHTRLKTPTATAEFIINKIENYDSYINELARDFVSLVNTKITGSENQLNIISTDFQHIVSNRLSEEKMNINITTKDISNVYINFCTKKRNELKEYSVALKNSSGISLQNKLQDTDKLKDIQKYLLKEYFSKQLFRIHITENTASNSDPVKLLKKGYSLTTLNNKIIKDISQLKENDIIRSHFKDGFVNSLVKNVEKKK